jgi:hypothetical protein
MQNINLKKIIEDTSMDTGSLAKKLFPTHRFPKKALERILESKSNLDSVQISKLAMILGVSISDLYGPTKWKLNSNRSGVIRFSSEEYEAELDTETMVTNIFKNNTLIHEAVLNKRSTTLSEYLEDLSKIIQNL